MTEPSGLTMSSMVRALTTISSSPENLALIGDEKKALQRLFYDASLGALLHAEPPADRKLAIFLEKLILREGAYQPTAFDFLPGLLPDLCG